MAATFEEYRSRTLLLNGTEYEDNLLSGEHGNVTATFNNTDEFTDSMTSSSERFVNNLSQTQAKFLSAIGFPSALLSLTGSALIIYMITREKKFTPYRGLVFALSSCDVLTSIGTIVDPFLLPKGAGPWAIGNDATCSISGFMWQVLSLSLWYNGGLSFYFLATVRFGMRPDAYSFPYELLWHVASFCFALTTAIHGLVIGIYGPIIGTSCWIANDYPEGCVDVTRLDDPDIVDTDVVSCKTDNIAWIYGGLPYLLIFVALCVNNMVIYCFVKRTIVQSIRNSSVYEISNQNASDGTMSVNNAGFMSRTSTATQSIWKTQMTRLRAVRTQSLLYVGAFMITYIWLLIQEMAKTFTVVYADQWLPLLALNNFFYPLQGFFNFFIFIRRQYMIHRGANQDLTRLQVLRLSVFETSIRSSSAITS